MRLMICRFAERAESEKRNVLDYNKRIPINGGAEAAKTGRDYSPSSSALACSQPSMFSREYRVVVVVVLKFVTRKLVTGLKFAPGYNSCELRRSIFLKALRTALQKVLLLRTE